MGSRWFSRCGHRRRRPRDFGVVCERLEPRWVQAADAWSLLGPTAQPFPYVTAMAIAGSPPPYATTLTYDVTFSEPVTGVDATDFLLDLSGVTATTPVTVAGSGGSYTVTVGGIAGIGTLGLNLVDDGSIRDLSGAPLTSPGAAPSFEPLQTVAAGPWPFGAAIGYLDGNGTLDIVVTNSTSNTVGVLLNQGAGTLLPQVSYATGSNPWSVAIGNLDGDGVNDLAVANVNAGTVSILLGVGDGTFGPQQTFAAGWSPYSVALGDVNGDGKADLVFANIDVSSVTVILGDGTGAFGPPLSLGAGVQPSSVSLGDVDKDGFQDIAVTNFMSNTVGIFLGAGDGTFAPQVTYATGSRPYSVALGDLDDDGWLDMAVTNSSGNTIGVFLNAGDGTFTAQVAYATSSNPNIVRIGDVTGDGIVDLAVTEPYADRVSVMPGVGDGTFAAAVTFTAGRFSVSTMLGDLDGDGRLDLAFANYYGDSVGTLRNTITGDFTGEVATVVVGMVYPVTTTASDGPGSLRQAILAANAHPGFDTITFALPGAGRRIEPSSALPVITGPVAIDGTTQSGVVLAGTRLSRNQRGLAFAGDATGSFVTSLSLRGFSGSAIHVKAVAVTVEACTIARNGTGVSLVAAAASVIGGADAAAGNLFTRNVRGIAVSGACTAAVVGSNRFRGDDTAVSLVDATGVLVVGNEINGLNVTRIGLSASGGLSGTVVQGNTITATLSYGVRLASARGITVGFTAAGPLSTSAAANVIFGNRLFGLAACGLSTGSAVRRNTIFGNGIDVSVAGARGLIYVP